MIGRYICIFAIFLKQKGTKPLRRKGGVLEWIDLGMRYKYKKHKTRMIGVKGHSERPQGEQAKMKHDKIKHPGNVLLTGRWWEDWGWLAQTIVPTPSSQPWQRFHLLHTDMGMGTMVPPAPACPGSVCTPTLWERTPKLLQPQGEAEAQATCLTPVHLSTSAPVGISVTLFFCLLWYFRRQPWLFEQDPVSWFSKCSWLCSKALLLPFSPVQVRTVNLSPVTSSISSSLLSLSLSLSTTSSPGVNFAVTYSPSSLSFLSLYPLLSHRACPPNTVTLSPSLSLSLSLYLYISLALSGSLSLPIVEGAHELWMSNSHWPTI